MEKRKNCFQKRSCQDNVDKLSMLPDPTGGTNEFNSEMREIQSNCEERNEENSVRIIRTEHAKYLKELPMSQRYQFVSSSSRERSARDKQINQSIVAACSFNYPSEFPALGDRKIKNKNNDTDHFRHPANILEHGGGNEIEKGEMSKKEPKNSSLNWKMESSTSNNKQDKTKATKKVPRTERPITVDLVEACESFKMKKLQSKSVSKMSKCLLKRRVQPKPHGGNILDSDQPLIHKGKIRLNEKKRVTKIKAVILEKRHSWRTKKNEWKSALDSSKKIKLTSDMIKDALLLKSCNFILHEREELVAPSACSHPFEKNESTYKITELETQVHKILATTNKSIREFDEKDHESSHIYLDDNLNIIDGQIMTPKRIIHSKRFAIYCDQWPIAELTEAVNELLKKLDCFQQKTQACDPLKLYSKRRFNLGLTEVTKYLRLGKIVMIIFATDIEEVDGRGGLLDTINNMRKMASVQKVPFVFANTQKKLRGILKKNARISCIGIRNYEGADTHFKTILSLLPEAKRLYQEKLESAEIMCGRKSEESELDPNVAVVQSLLSKLTSPSSQAEDEINTPKNDSVNEECPFLSAIIKHEKNSTT